MILTTTMFVTGGFPSAGFLEANGDAIKKVIAKRLTGKYA
jgi:hypothetical protein